MSASLVGSEMCIRDRFCSVRGAPNSADSELRKKLVGPHRGSWDRAGLFWGPANFDRRAR
eukprot:11770101-Alexandrium_andersonii.AAC.1